MPFMEIQNVCYAVEPPFGLQEVRILRKKPCVDDSSSVILGLEMGIRKTDEDLLQRAPWEVLAEMSHGVGSNNRNMIEFSLL